MQTVVETPSSLTPLRLRLIAAYAKNEKDNLTKAERNALEKMATAIFEKYGR